MLSAKMKKPLLRAAHNRGTQFAFAARIASPASSAGDFNDWNTQAGLMPKGVDSGWRLSLPLKPGHYEYGFFADGSRGARRKCR